MKTIKPTAMGGIVGGDKYIVNNILFKFAVGTFKKRRTSGHARLTHVRCVAQ